MSGVFDAHYRVIQEAFARNGKWLAIAHFPNGDVDYVYEQDRLLVADGVVGDVLGALGLHADDRDTVVGHGAGFTTVSIGNVPGGRLHVPDALEFLDDRFNRDVAPGQTPRVSPNHLVHIERLCAAVEPEPPCGAAEPLQPCPAQVPQVEDEKPVRVGLVDSGLVQPVDPRLGWLQGVAGDDDPVIALSNGRRLIPPFAGHGTFVAGVTRCMAPMSDIYVGNELDTRGAELEDKIAEKAEQLIARHQPAIINISSGTYCRHDWAPIGFNGFRDRYPDLTVVAAAGNDGTARPLYPAAFDWVISVGALGPDQTNRAWFSNFGPTVNVYTLGEGMINAFTTGEYRYHEPPRRPARQTFELPIARWDGTSFAAPLITGMIASRMGRTGESSQDAWQALLAETTQIDGLGPAVRVG